MGTERGDGRSIKRTYKISRKICRAERKDIGRLLQRLPEKKQRKRTTIAVVARI